MDSVQDSRSTRNIEVMDTTLRDGEQTQGVAMLPDEKLAIARILLERLKVNRIEIASARVSAGEKRAVEQITSWAAQEGYLDCIELLGFCDVNKSADWIGEAGGRVMNLLAKGSYKHLTEQLRKTPEEHVAAIAETVAYCQRNGITCNCYPEDWSGGLQEKDQEYAHWLIRQLVQLPIARIMLPDTLGRLCPHQVSHAITELVAEFPEAHFDFHPHNDYGLATANMLAAVQAGIHGIHVTLNGLGERAGNASLDETVVAIHDFTPFTTTVQETELQAASRMVEVISSRRLAPNKPITGSVVFTQTAGIHADGDKKGNLYVGRLNPERFQRTVSYALGKHSGKASLEMNLTRMGIDLTPEQKQTVLQRIVELGDQKEFISPEDLPFIIADVLQTPETQPLAIADFVVTTTAGVKPCASLKVLFEDREYQQSANGDGGYDAFMHALEAILEEIGFSMPALLDYEAHIPPGGKTDALVEVKIIWEGNVVTRGVDSDQLRAAVIATEHMLNRWVQHQRRRIAEEAVPAG